MLGEGDEELFDDEGLVGVVGEGVLGEHVVELVVNGHRPVAKDVHPVAVVASVARVEGKLHRPHHSPRPSLQPQQLRACHENVMWGQGKALAIANQLLR